MSSLEYNVDQLCGGRRRSVKFSQNETDLLCRLIGASTKEGQEKWNEITDKFNAAPFSVVGWSIFITCEFILIHIVCSFSVKIEQSTSGESSQHPEMFQQIDGFRIETFVESAPLEASTESLVPANGSCKRIRRKRWPQSDLLNAGDERLRWTSRIGCFSTIVLSIASLRLCGIQQCWGANSKWRICFIAGIDVCTEWPVITVRFRV